MGKKANPPPPVEQEPAEQAPVEQEPPWDECAGEWTFPSGSSYKGQYLRRGEEVVLHGKGFLQTGPESFEGTFDHGAYKVGRYTSCSGDVYEGCFRSNLLHGRGTYTWPDRRVYRGLWRDGQMHGPGQYENFSFGVNGRFSGVSLGGRFESSREAQARLRQAYVAEYSAEYLPGARAAVSNMADPEMAKRLFGADERLERCVDGPVPDVSVVQPPFQKFVAHLAEGSALSVALLEERAQSRFIGAGRIKCDQLEHHGQCVEFSAHAAEPGSVIAVGLVNVSEDYDPALASWKVAYFETEPYPEGWEAEEEHPKGRKK